MQSIVTEVFLSSRFSLSVMLEERIKHRSGYHEPIVQCSWSLEEFFSAQINKQLSTADIAWILSSFVHNRIYSFRLYAHRALLWQFHAREPFFWLLAVYGLSTRTKGLTAKNDFYCKMSIVLSLFKTDYIISYEYRND